VSGVDGGDGVLSGGGEDGGGGGGGVSGGDGEDRGGGGGGVEVRRRQVLHLLRSEGGLASLEDAGHLLSYSLSSDLTMLSL